MAGAENDSEVVKARVENSSGNRANALLSDMSDIQLLGHSVRDQ